MSTKQYYRMRYAAFNRRTAEGSHPVYRAPISRERVEQSILSTFDSLGHISEENKGYTLDDEQMDFWYIDADRILHEYVFILI